jgi:GH24 family phage-related lysozyme (muramidase)
MLSGPDFATYLRILDQFEGRFSWMYLDGSGNVTVGCGHLVATANEAVRIGLSASDWHLLKLESPAARASRYAQFTTSRLADARIDVLKLADLTAAWSGIVALWPACASFPTPVQVAVCDMSFNLGAAKLFREFPIFRAACERGDWAAAATESHRNGIQESRNEWTAEMLKSAATPEVTT